MSPSRHADLRSQPPSAWGSRFWLSPSEFGHTYPGQPDVVFPAQGDFRNSEAEGTHGRHRSKNRFRFRAVMGCSSSPNTERHLHHPAVRISSRLVLFVV